MPRAWRRVHLVGSDVSDVPKHAPVDLPPQGFPRAAEAGGGGQVANLEDSGAAVRAEARALSWLDESGRNCESEALSRRSGGRQVRGHEACARHLRAPDLGAAQLDDRESGRPQLATREEGGTVGEHRPSSGVVGKASGLGRTQTTLLFGSMSPFGPPSTTTKPSHAPPPPHPPTYT